jgi:hypothetical protein
MADYSDLLRSPAVAAAPARARAAPLDPSSPDAAALARLAAAGRGAAPWVEQKMGALGAEVSAALDSGALSKADAEALLQGLAKQLAGFAPGLSTPQYQALLRRELAGPAGDRTLSNAAAAAAGGFSALEAGLREGPAAALPGLRALAARAAQMRCAVNCERCGARPGAAAAAARCGAECAPGAPGLQRWAVAADC